jgi:nucleotide-binding universal stress UspA family protein
MKTILAPIDFSLVSERVAHEAMALARGLGGRLVLLNVTSPPFAAADDPRIAKNITGAIATVEKSAAKRLEKLRKKLDQNGVSVSAIQVTGVPVPAIVHEAQTVSADYIVMGSHGHNALYDLVVGSTAHGVMHESPCPVLVVPPRPKPAVKARR